MSGAANTDSAAHSFELWLIANIARFRREA
jgi:hypothetical protein